MYSTTEKVGLSGGMGSVGDAPTTYFQYSNGTVRRWPGSEEHVTIKLKDLLEKAGVSSLDVRNTNGVRPSAYVNGVLTQAGRVEPPYRTTGVFLQVNLRYENTPHSNDGDPPRLPPEFGQPNFNHRAVHTTVKLQSSTGQAPQGWAGWGSQVFYTELPTGSGSVQTYHKVIRYRQGVILDFVASGVMYKLDFWLFIRVIIDAIVLISVAKTVTDVVTFYVWERGEGTTKLLSNLRNERVSRKRSFAQLGVRAALSARQFDVLDTYKTGKINYKDLVSIFGKVKGVSFDTVSRCVPTVRADCGG